MRSKSQSDVNCGNSTDLKLEPKYQPIPSNDTMMVINLRSYTM